MKNLLTILIVALSVVGLVSSKAYAAGEKEKVFIDAYKKAYEAKDEEGLKKLMYTKGADPMALEFYTMMITGDLDGTISNIELKDLSDEDKKKAAEVQELPTGGTAKLPVTPSKKLMLQIEHKSASGSSKSTSQSFVAEVDGKYLIPVPATVK